MDRITVFEAVLNAVKSQLERLEQAVETQHKVIDTTPGPTQSHSDTSRFQESEVVQEMTKSLEELRQVWSELNFFRADIKPTSSQIASVGSVVIIDSSGSSDIYMILPCGGGTEITVEDGKTVSVITQNSPLALAIIGKTKGAEFELRTKTVRKLKLLEVL